MDAAACAAELKARFPALFGGAPKPIKLRIQADIQARAPGVFPRQALSAFLHRHTTSTLYLIALSQQPHRLDLDGQPAGEVSAEHRDAAAKEVERRRALRKEREAQMRDARRAALQAEREQARAQGRGSAGDAGGRPPRDGDPRARRRPPHDDRPRPGRPPREVQRPAAVPAAPSVATPPRMPRPPMPAGPAAGAADDDAGRRERARLLRDFESSPLAKSNFCALKGLTIAELDAQLAQARQEAAARAAAPARAGDERDRPHRRRDARPPGDRPRRPAAATPPTHKDPDA
jgi:sRNA-binding protein